MPKLMLSEVLSKNVMDLNLAASTKQEAIEELSNLLFENNKIDSVEDFVEDVLLREKEGVTGLGKGVAIPHGKSESVVQTFIAIGRTKKLIEWESLDDEPVNIIILFAVKNTDANTTHIKMLQNVAVHLADDTFIPKLQHIKNESEMMKLFLEGEEKNK